MTEEHIISAAQCSAKTEFGRCRYKAGGHTRHHAKTTFGEMWWDEPIVPTGTGSPTPAPPLDDARALHAKAWAVAHAAGAPPGALASLASAHDTLVTEVERLRAEVQQWRATYGEAALRDASNVLAEREQLRAELSQVQKERDAAQRDLGDAQAELADLRAVQRERDKARAALAALRADFDRLHSLWEQAAAIVADEGDVFETDQEVLDAIQAKDDIAANDTYAVEVASSWRRTRDSLNEARAALAALRTEVGKIADEYGREAVQARRRHDATTAATSAARWHLGGAAQVWRDASERLRVLVTDQSTRECTTCNGTSVVKCAAHVAGDGCDDLALRCPDCITDQPSSAPYGEAELLRTRFEQAADAWETLAEESRTYADSSIVPAIRSRSEAVARTYQACSNAVRAMLVTFDLSPAALGGCDDQC